jgi:hypothetical protein
MTKSKITAATLAALTLAGSLAITSGSLAITSSSPLDRRLPRPSSRRSERPARQCPRPGGSLLQNLTIE